MDMNLLRNIVANGGTTAQKLLASGMDINCLRTNATLRQDEWKVLDAEIISEAQNRLVVVRDVLTRGLTLNLKNGLGTTILESENVGDMNAAQVSMNGVTKGSNDTVNYEVVGLPLPMIHKDYSIEIRKLNSSRNQGEALDATQAGLSARKVADIAEDMLLNGYSMTYGGYTIYGYTNYTNRNTVTLSVDWDASSKTGKQIVDDVLSCKQALIAAKFFGPFAMYVPTAYDTRLDEDYSDSKGSNTVRERILAIKGVESIEVADHMTANNVVMVQMTKDVVREVIGMPITNVEWSSEGGMIFNFKVMEIMVPQIRSDQSGNCGIAHLS